MRSRPVSLVHLLIVSLLSLWAVAAQAVVVDNLYRAQVPVEGVSEEQRRQSLGEALKKVAVKASGTQAAATHAAVEEAAQNAQQYAAQYAYVDNGSGGKALQATFSQSAIDRLLLGAGLPVWGSNRPALVTWIAVEQDGQRALLGAEGSGPLVAALEQRAEERGVPLVVPLMDLEDSGVVSAADVWNLSSETVKRASNRYSHDAVLMAQLAQDGTGQWQGQWQLLTQSEVLTGTVSAGSASELVQSVVDSVAERLASRYAVQGSSVTSGQIQIEVVGVDSLKDYADLSRYLSSMAPVSNVQPVLVQPNRVRYTLTLRGPVEQVQEYIALEKRLRPELVQNRVEAQPTPATAPELYYRWQP